jgi:hypothetical protein
MPTARPRASLIRLKHLLRQGSIHAFDIPIQAWQIRIAEGFALLAFCSASRILERFTENVPCAAFQQLGLATNACYAVYGQMNLLDGDLCLY